MRAGTRYATVLRCVISAVCVLAADALPASAQFKAWVMAKLPDAPEGLAVDARGNIYATLFHTGEVIMLKDDGSYDHIALELAGCLLVTEFAGRISTTVTTRIRRGALSALPPLASGARLARRE